MYQSLDSINFEPRKFVPEQKFCYPEKQGRSRKQVGSNSFIFEMYYETMKQNSEY